MALHQPSQPTINHLRAEIDQIRRANQQISAHNGKDGLTTFFAKAVHGKGDAELPRQRHLARARPFPRGFGRARRYRPLLPRVWTQKAGRRESKSWDTSQHVRLRHRPEAAGNPRKGIVRYRRPPRGRLIGADDLARLGAVLRMREGENPVRVAAVRLLLLTGCWPGAIGHLRWCEVKPDRLTLIDSKTGPRHVLLGEAARELLRGLAETASGEWVYPCDRGGGSLSTDNLWRFWIKARDAAGIVAVGRLHDLCHSHASYAVVNGESLYVAGRLLGHRRASATIRYVDLDDVILSHATERAAAGIQGKLHPISRTAAKVWICSSR